jgi:uncharacterized protein YodC (DUF2158 family)
MPFNQGDRVRLQLGGAMMTVHSTGAGGVTCWFFNRQELETTNVKPTDLVLMGEADPNPGISVGDHVKLRSGGPLMRVDSIYQGAVACSFGTGRATFPILMLMRGA